MDKIGQICGVWAGTMLARSPRVSEGKKSLGLGKLFIIYKIINYWLIELTWAENEVIVDGLLVWHVEL